jgi:hypothetical protein
MHEKHQLPTERQKEKLCEMLADAIDEMRALTSPRYFWDRSRKLEQVGELANAFHNLPREIYGWGTWDWDLFRERLCRYQCKYLGEDEAETGFVVMLDQIRNEP